VIGARWSYTIPLVAKVSGPEFVIFKPGYGQWRLREGGYEAVKRRFDGGEEVGIEMPLLKTREERLKFHDSVIRPTGVVPSERMRYLNGAWEEDRASLGFKR